MEHINSIGVAPTFGSNKASKRNNARAMRANLTPAEEVLWKYLRGNLARIAFSPAARRSGIHSGLLLQSLKVGH
jgi:hypothetical protein